MKKERKGKTQNKIVIAIWNDKLITCQPIPSDEEVSTFLNELESERQASQ